MAKLIVGSGSVGPALLDYPELLEACFRVAEEMGREQAANDDLDPDVQRIRARFAGAR